MKDTLIRKILMSICLIGSLAFVQLHAIQMWTSVVGLTAGVAASITLEAGAITLFLSRSRFANLVGFCTAIILILAASLGTANHALKDEVTAVQEKIAENHTISSQLAIINQQITIYEIQIEKYQDQNLKNKVGRTSQINQSIAAISKLRNKAITLTLSLSSPLSFEIWLKFSLTLALLTLFQFFIASFSIRLFKATPISTRPFISVNLDSYLSLLAENPDPTIETIKAKYPNLDPQECSSLLSFCRQLDVMRKAQKTT